MSCFFSHSSARTVDITLSFAQKAHCLWMKWNMMFHGTKCFYQVILITRVTDRFITKRWSVCNSSYINFLTEYFSLKATCFIFADKSPASSFFFCSPSLPFPLSLSLIHLTYVYIASIYCVFSFVKCWYISLLLASEWRGRETISMIDLCCFRPLVGFSSWAKPK